MNAIDPAWDGSRWAPKAFPYFREPRLKMRTALIDSLREMLTDQQFDQIHIRDITEHAGISYSSFYRHYATKEALLGDLVKTEIARVILVGMPHTEALQRDEASLAVCGHIAEHKNLWRALLSGGAEHKLREEFVRQMMKLRGHPNLKGSLPEELHLACATGATLTVFIWWLTQDPMPPIEVAAAKMGEVIAAIESCSLHDPAEPTGNATAA